MPRGGTRNNAGRKIGAKSRLVKENERESKALDDGLLPLDFLLSVMRGDGKNKRVLHDMDMRIEAAKAAAPYVHRKQPIDVNNTGGTFPIPLPTFLIVNAGPELKDDQQPT